MSTRGKMTSTVLAPLSYGTSAYPGTSRACINAGSRSVVWTCELVEMATSARPSGEAILRRGSVVAESLASCQVILNTRFQCATTI